MSRKNDPAADPYRVAGIRVPETCPVCGADLPEGDRITVVDLDRLGVLDEAFNEAYAAIPDGWMLRGIWCRQYRRARKWTAVAEPVPRGKPVTGIADNPVSALRALTVALRGTGRG